MLWRVGIPTMLLAWVLLAAPAAAAGIQRHIDSQGVIRISNSIASPSVQSRKESSNTPNNPTAAPVPDGELDSQPPLAAGEESSPQVQAPAAPSPQNLSPETRLDPVCLQNPLRPENQGIARAPEIGADAGPLPVKKVAFTGAQAGPAAISAPRMGGPRKPEGITTGGIQRFRDHQGVLHISNVPAGQENSPPPGLEARKSGDFIGKGFPAEGPVQAAALPLQKVSWSPDNPGVAPLLAAAATAGNPAPLPGHTIRCYRDGQGMIHIQNMEPGAQATMQPPQTLARAGPGDERAPPEAQIPPPGGAGEQMAQEPGTRAGEGLPSPPTALISTPFGQPETALLGGIRRHRDRLGVWHLETAKAPGLPELPALPRLPELGGKLTLASLNPATVPPGASGTPGAARLSGPAPGRTYGGIAVLRDHRGRLTITNAQPVAEAGRSLAGVETRALLEPIIQEAARAYGLPATLIRAVIKVESNFGAGAVSPKGAMGLMQLMPGTAAFLGVQDPFNPRENILGGCRYLRLLIDYFGGSWQLALAGYNAGYHRVVACGYRVPDIKETQEFLTQVTGWYLAEEKKALLPRI